MEPIEAPPKPGDSRQSVSPPVFEVLVRIAEGVEKLSEDIVINAEFKPPVCPHCERMNPNVTVADKEATGDLASFVIQARCNHCQHVIYAMPTMWETFREVEELREAMSERDEASGIN